MINSLKRRYLLLAIVGILFALYVYEKFESISQLPSNEQCIATFDEFAYTFPMRRGLRQEEVLPMHPWEAISPLPEVKGMPEARQVVRELEVIAARTINEEPEIWLSNTHAWSTKDLVYLIYYPLQDKWLQIPAEIANSSTKVESLHISKDQSVWAIGLQARKVTLAVFDDASKHFVEQSSQASSRIFQDDFSENIWASNDIFWMFAKGDAVFSFDPRDSEIRKHASLTDYGDLSSLIYDPKGFLLFSDYKYGDPTSVRYSISTNKITEFPSRNGRFLSNLLVDHKSNLWLRDAYGWRTSDGVLHRIHPDPINHWWRMEIAQFWQYYVPPNPFLETSDGRIWFRIYRSEEWRTLRSGIAWFHPETKKGCWFTSEGAEIVEDSQNNLWMVIEEKLYKYEGSSIQAS